MIRGIYRLLLFSLFLGLISCHGKENPVSAPPLKGVADLKLYEQSVSAYCLDDEKKVLLNIEEQKKFDQIFNRKFFSPWHQHHAGIDKEKAFWGIKHYGAKRGFSENLRRFSHEEWKQLIELQQISTYPSLSKPAITIRNTSLRLFPTSRPFFLDPKNAGEGFPFDYFQTSAIAVGNPLYATHISRDGAWVFVESNFAFGWIPNDDIAWVSSTLQRRYENGVYAAILHDDTSLYNANGTFLTQADLGALFPVIRQKGSQLALLIPVRNGDGGAELRIAVTSSTMATLKPLLLTPATIAQLADPLIGQKYGWGGLFDNRDCSSTMRDLFTPFGIWLGRNSQNQGLNGGEFFDLRDKSTAEKEEVIKSKGIPFATLIWLKGHIGLYLGIDPQSKEPLLLHNIWGVRTYDASGREGREVIGQLAITTLHLGEERLDVQKNGFYGRVQGMTIVTSLSNNQNGAIQNKKGSQPKP